VFRNNLVRIQFVYRFLDSLKGMFWLSVLLVVLAAAWELIVLTAVAILSQSLVDVTQFDSSSFSPDSALMAAYNQFKTIPEEYRLITGFSLAAISVLIGSIVDTSTTTFQTSFSTRFLIQVRCKIFSMLCNSSLSYIDQEKTGSLITMVINESRCCYNVLKNGLQLTVGFFKVAIFAGVLWFISPLLTLVVVAISLIFVFETALVSKLIKRISVIVVSSTRALTVDTEESLQGIRLIKLFGVHDSALLSFKGNSTLADNNTRKQSIILQWQRVLVNGFVIGTVGLLIFFNMKLSLVSIALMLTFLVTTQKLYQVLLGINSSLGLFNSDIPRVDGLIEFVDRYRYVREASGSSSPAPLFTQEIRFDKVRLDYMAQSQVQGPRNKGAPALNDVTLTISKGETVAIVGESGSGKSSLVNLLVRLYDPTDGRILFDKLEAGEIDLSLLREKIGIASQDTILFNKTIRENIALGRRDAREEEVIEAAILAHVHEFVMNYPDGYETVIGDRGVKLSGGQRQRLNIAQNFLKRPEVLILDEATSALDSLSESYVQSAVAKMAEFCTCIIIAHRLATIQHADRVVVLEKGEIAEIGTWDQLMRNEGKFFDMVKRQTFSVVE
jgi:ATP-binding cassette, subfamily B, putative efflux pump